MSGFNARIQCLASIVVLFSILVHWDAFAVEPDLQVADLLASYAIDESDRPVREFSGWQPPRHVAMLVPSFVEDLRPDYRQWIQEAAGDAKITVSADLNELREAAIDADVVLGTCRVLTGNSTNLRWFQRYGSGMDTCLRNPALGNEAALLTNTAGLDGPYVGEHAIAMMMVLAHRMHQYYANQLERDWDRRPGFQPLIRPVAGKSLLVVGLGGIGTQVAQKAAGLGMKVTAIRNSGREGPDYVDYVGLSHELLTLAARADFIVNTVPLTVETMGLYDEEFFRAMRDSAYFINVARGPSVVTEDLIRALELGELAGAGLDVTDPDPLPASSPLWLMPNVIITPHTATRSGVGSFESMTIVRENLRRYVAGEPMLNVVDRELGY